MGENQGERINRLIHEKIAARDKLREELHRFESGQYKIGTTEVGNGNGDISEPWIQQLRERIADMDSVIADLQSLRSGAANSI